MSQTELLPQFTFSQGLLFIFLFTVFLIIVILLIHYCRYYIEPTYRQNFQDKLKEDNLRKEEKRRRRQEEKQRRQRALNSMTTTERLLYEQNKELNRIHWYLTLRDLFAPRRRR